MIVPVLEKYRDSISGIIHCTGGGQAKCRDFGKNIRIVKDNLFELPAIFKTIYESGAIPMKEMFQEFNCGHRIEFYCDESVAQGIIDIAKSFNIDARVVGHVEALPEGSENEVVISYNGETYLYN